MVSKQVPRSASAYENSSPELRVVGVGDEVGGDRGCSCAMAPAVQMFVMSDLGWFEGGGVHRISLQCDLVWITSELANISLDPVQEEPF